MSRTTDLLLFSPHAWGLYPHKRCHWRERSLRGHGETTVADKRGADPLEFSPPKLKETVSCQMKRIDHQFARKGNTLKSNRMDRGSVCLIWTQVKMALIRTLATGHRFAPSVNTLKSNQTDHGSASPIWKQKIARPYAPKANMPKSSPTGHGSVCPTDPYGAGL